MNTQDRNRSHSPSGTRSMMSPSKSIGESVQRSSTADSGQSPGNEENPGGWSSSNTRSMSRRKREKKPVSIEEVFNQVSVITSSNINPPPAKVVLTPRSAEACLKLGLNPEILKIRDMDSFWEAGIDPSVQRYRHEAYVQRRYEMMKQCRLERKRPINAEFNKSTELSAASEFTNSVNPLKHEEEVNATLIEFEKNRLEKLRRRQEKELEQMLQVEVYCMLCFFLSQSPICA